MGNASEAVTRQERRLPTTARDAALAAGFAVVVLIANTDQAWQVQLLLLLGCAPVVLHRRLPVTVALTVGALAFYVGATFANDILVVVAAFAAGSAAYHRRAAFPWLVPLAALWNAAYAFFGYPVGPDLFGDAFRVSAVGAMGTVSVVAGHLLRLRADRDRQRVRMLRAWAQQERLRERTRIARDVHDIAGHHLSAIRLLAVGGRESLNGEHEKAGAVLGSIAEVSGRGVQEVRELLELLRDDRLTEPPPPDVRLDDLPILAAALADTGVDVDLAAPQGVASGVSAQVEADAYRIVQESLSNVLRHSSAHHVLVRLSRSVGELVVTVEDDGLPLPDAEGSESTGNGLVGMRERAEALGGRLYAGFRPGTGWRVQAVLPLHGDGRADGDSAP